jgi:acyl-CoA thioester hydrolase
MPDVDPFRFRVPVGVRFQDVDVYGHAHHSRALIYFEEARWAYWGEVVGATRVEEVSYVMAEVKVRYHRRVLYPMTLEVCVRVSSVADKHFVMEYEARSPEGEVLVTGNSVQVMYDYEAQGATQVPESIRTALEQWDGPFPTSDNAVVAGDRRPDAKPGRSTHE